MTNNEAIDILEGISNAYDLAPCENRALDMAIQKLSKENHRRGDWLRMSECSEDIDNRYKCSLCGNVVRYKDRVTLMTYSRWCGRCGAQMD